MLPKNQRLGRAAFAQVFAAGSRIHDPHATVVYRLDASFKAAVVVSKKVAKKAHERNLVRRRFYTIIRNIIDSNRNIKGEYIFIIKPTIKNLSKKEFKSLITLEVGRTLK